MDWESRTWFRRLSVALGSAPLAVQAALCTFRDCAYAVSDRAERPGFLDAGQAQLLAVAILERFPEPRPLTDQVIAHLETSTLLTRQEDGWFCAPFAEENQHLFTTKMQVLGGVTRGVRVAAQRLEASAAQQTLLINPPMVRRPDTGETLSGPECNRLTLTIMLIDRNLGRNPSTTSQYSQGLLDDAWRVCSRYSDETIQAVCCWLRLQADKAHPAVPRTAEQVLADFDRYAALAK